MIELNSLTELQVQMKDARLKFDNVSTAPVVIAKTNFSASLAQSVVIVMATYNGQRFIEEQIRSIQAQSFSDWKLFVRDDGSSDDTVQKISQIECEDNRISLIRDDAGNQGAIGNFAFLMKVAHEEGAEYVFFADQDDVWRPDKMETMLAAILELERIHGARMPLLVHSDLMVVNEALEPISESFVMFSRLSPAIADLGVLLCQNQVTGCACVSNRALIELAYPVPGDVLMHDWWLALLASSVGKIGYIPMPLVKYRQHTGNVIGAISFVRRFRKLMFSLQQWKMRMEVIRGGFVQAGRLEARIKARNIELSPIVMSQISTYSHILNVTPAKRASNLHAQQIGKPAKIQGLAFDILITVMKKNEAKPVT